MVKVQNRKEFKMKAKIFDNWYLVEKMRAKLKAEKGRMIYSRRMPTIEKIFGHIKKNMGCIRFRVRGIEKVKTEWSGWMEEKNHPPMDSISSSILEEVR